MAKFRCENRTGSQSNRLDMIETNQSVWRFLGWASSHSTQNVAGTSGWSVPISSQLMNSFIGSGLISGPLPPAKSWSFTSLQMSHTLAQTGLIDLGCGMYRAYKRHQQFTWEERRSVEFGKLAADATHALIWSWVLKVQFWLENTGRLREPYRNLW